MSTFTIILLTIIFVLIASDVFFLWKIFKSIGSRKRSIPDERYFELKYNINLLKAVSAILIFLLGFLGFTTYQDITKIVEGDFEEKFAVQQGRIDNLDSIVKDYEETVKFLKSEEGQSIENLNDIKKEFGVIGKRLSDNNEALKDLIKVYAVKEVQFSPNIVDNANEKSPQTKIEYQDVYFNTLRTMYGEKLPEFKDTPLVIIQSKIIDVELILITKDFFRITRKRGGFVDVIIKGQKLDKSFNLLIASKD